MRWSAAIENWHRIHYDRDYATRIEGYSGLIVHGPLQASLLIEVLSNGRVADAVVFPGLVTGQVPVELIQA